MPKLGRYQVVAQVGPKRLTFYGNSVDQIVRSIHKSRTQNKDPNTNIQEIHDYVEGLLEPSKDVTSAQTRAKRDASPAPTTHRNKRIPSIKEAWSATKALVKTSAGDQVDEEEYLRRAAICKLCPSRKRHSECMGCGGAGKVAREVNAMRVKLGLTYKIDNIIGRHFCGVCGCSLALLLVTKTSDYKKETPEQQQERPMSCWLRNASPNFNGK